MYHAVKPNKDEKAACDELQNVMANSQACLADSQAEMGSMLSTLDELSAEAYDYNTMMNDMIIEEKTSYDGYAASLEALKTKSASGQPLTESERALWAEAAAMMAETGGNIEDISSDGTATVAGIQDDMASFQDGYNYIGETVAEVQGAAEYTQQFAQGARTGMYVAAASQTMNAVSGAVAGARLLSTGMAPGMWWQLPIAAASLAAGVTSGIAAKEQFDWAGQAGTAKELGGETLELNAQTNDILLADVETYGALTDGVGGLEHVIPDDVEPPEESAPPPLETPTSMKKPVDTSGLKRLT
jgi:hypothetical protein